MNGRFARRLIPRKKTPVGQTEEEESSSFKDEESDSEEFTSGFDSEESHMVVPKSVLIGESGYYQIHKIFVPIGEPKRRGGRFAVGVTLRTKEWLAADLRHSFPGFTSCSVIYTVGKGSLAEQAGVRPNDILCWFKGPEPVVFHILVSSAQNHSCAWELIEQAQFEEHLKSVQDENSFTFYVARKMPAASPAHPSFVVNGITLSNEVAVKAETFHSLCSEGKWKLMKEIKEDAKKNFEADRDAVLASLPESFKGSFNQIGFAKWGQKYWPVLVLSPYRIPPGNVRNLWLTKFELVSESGIKWLQ